MPPGKHSSGADSGRGNGRGSDRDPARDSARDSAADPAREPGPARDSDPGPARDSEPGPARDSEPDDVVTVEHLLTPGDPARRTPPADHDRYAYVLEGQVGAQIGAETLIAGPGSIISIPRGRRHSLRSTGGATARVLVVHVREKEPGGPAQRRATA